MLYAIIGLYMLGVFLRVMGRKASYAAALAASILSFILGLKATFFGYHPSFHTTILPNIVVGIGIDKLSGLFLMIVALSWTAISIFSLDFGINYRKRMAQFLNLAMLGMFLILTSYDGLSFLMGWEVMTIASYLLITEHEGVYKEAFQFLAFSEVSTICLIVAFVGLYLNNGSFSFAKHSASALFLIFASIAFIIKMGIVPFHTWLKDAHSKAPSNASALLSAPVTLMGVYGLVRTIEMAGYNHTWGLLAIILGSISALWGALHAAAAKGLKVLPAYSTVENNGMILAALGLSVLVYSVSKNSSLSEFAFLTAIILSIAHTLAKTLLFLSIGQAKEQLGEDDIDNVRGIHKSVGKIPAFGIIVSGLSFSAFPALLGYVAEWMLLESIFQTYQFASVADRVISSTAGVLISLAIGLASFAMIKLIGYSALGYNHEKTAKRMPATFMRISELFLIVLIFGASFFSSYIFVGLGYSKFAIGALGVPKEWLLASAKPVFGVISPAFFVIVMTGLSSVPFFVYFKSKPILKSVTSWNGGLKLKESEYFKASAFSFTIEYILRFLYRTKETRKGGEAFVTISDISESFYTYLNRIAETAGRIISTTIMNGKIHFYVSYILFAFIMMFLIFG